MENQIVKMSAYEIVEKRTISDLNSEGYILKHKKTGARITLLLNDDENKVFFHGCFVPNSKKGQSVHTLVFVLLEFHAFSKLYLISWVS